MQWFTADRVHKARRFIDANKRKLLGWLNNRQTVCEHFMRWLDLWRNLTTQKVALKFLWTNILRIFHRFMHALSQNKRASHKQDRNLAKRLRKCLCATSKIGDCCAPDFSTINRKLSCSRSLNQGERVFYVHATWFNWIVKVCAK